MTDQRHVYESIVRRRSSMSCEASSRVIGRLAAVVAALPDHAVATAPSWSPRTLAEIISANSDEHYREHVEQIERWLAEQGGDVAMDRCRCVGVRPAKSLGGDDDAAPGRHAAHRAGRRSGSSMARSGARARRTRLRTKHLRRDPRSTLFVFDDGFALPDARVPGDDPRRRRTRRNRTSGCSGRCSAGMTPAPPAGKLMWFGAAEDASTSSCRSWSTRQRLIYEFEPARAYGMYGETPAR